MCIFLDGSVDGLPLKVFIGVAKVSRYYVLLFAVLKLVVQFLQLEHEIINYRTAIDLHRLDLMRNRFAKDHVLELVYHEELLQDGVYVADGAQILDANVFLADETLLRR